MEVAEVAAVAPAPEAPAVDGRMSLVVLRALAELLALVRMSVEEKK